MTSTFNIYCDESCHLEKDRCPVMVLGAITCPLEKTYEINRRIIEIKEKHGVPVSQEIKWTKISPSNVCMYEELIDYFFDDDDLKFRAIICDKTRLNHNGHAQTHDDWYYKMYFYLLRYLVNDRNGYNIYVDIKDSRSADKQRNLHKILCNDKYDFSSSFLKKIQAVRSHEIQILQLSDVLIGAASYANRGLVSSKPKLALISRIQERARLNTLLKSNYSDKFNVFQWQGRD